MANWTGTSKNDVKKGTGSADRLEGLAGNDTLSGDNGNDVLVGGAGADTLTGGQGKDTFVYTVASDSGVTAGSYDTITDFSRADGDLIDLSALGQITWGDRAALGGGKASAWYNPAATGSSLFVDTNGDGTADMRIDLTGVTSLAQTDLIGVVAPTTPTTPTTPSTPTTPTTAAAPDTASIAEDAASASVSGNILSNDASGYKLASVNGQKMPSSAKGTASVKGEHGTLAIGQDGKWSYTLNNQDPVVQALGVGETRVETFTYVTTGEGGATATSTLTVTITGTNDVPVAQEGTASGLEDAATITGRVKATDVDGDTLTYSVVQGPAPAQGALTFNPDGTYSFVPAKDFNGAVTFTYKANDGTADSSAATVTITVAAVNDAPVATGGDASGAEASIITGQVGGTDVDSPTLTYKLVTPVDGLTLAADGSYSYAAPKNVSGPVTFQYVANDGSLDSSARTVTITVGAVNDAPVAQDVFVQGHEDAAAITGSVVATDEDSATLIYSLVQGPTAEQGTLTFNEDGSYSFVPAADFNGTVAFTYKASDGAADSNTATATILVAAVNDAPVAQDGTSSGDEDGEAITGRVVATDVDGDTLIYSVVDGPAANQGVLTFEKDGTYSFVPAKDFNGTVSFTYKANDGAADSNTGTVTITVAAADEPNTAPVATGGDASGDEDTTITGRVGGTDAEGATLTYKLVAPVHGLTFNGDGSYSYAPAKDFNGKVTFDYVVSDGELDSAPKTVTITVAPVDEVPPVVSIADAVASEAVGSVEIPVTLSHASDQDVTLTYEASWPGKTITFDGTTEGRLPTGYEGVRWTGIFGDGKGSGLVATAGGSSRRLGVISASPA
ncbi:tandem-95 repeat protein [Sabulicella glaciei]